MDSNTKVAAEAVTRVYRARKTVLEMLRDRGYLIPQEHWISLDHFIELYGTEIRRENLSQVYQRPANYKDQIFVYFAEDAKVGVAAVKSLYEKMKGEQAQRAIVVIYGKLTPFARSALAGMNDEYIVEVFQEQEMLVNITKHVLVPEHRVLEPREKEELLQRYKLKDNQLPRIQLSDPIARYYGMARGEVVRIVRPSETAGRYVTYRIAL